MDAQRFARLVDLLGEALGLAPELQEAQLRRACGEDAPLLEEALSLLAQARATSLAQVTARLQQQVGSAAREVVEQAAARSVPHPEWIDRYEILEPLGEGGMGVVYRARQHQPLRREVAIKVMRAGWQAEAAARRFDFERQALAQMEHPNIAQVHDAGTTEDGRPYVVMELVSGVPLTAFCDERKLDVDSRLTLFVQVCLGVQHAHQRGIIHRDLKPSNLLVTEIDGVPVPKIIDFGIAKAVEQTADEQGRRTEEGLLVGTPEYMSPEQTRLSASAIDTRSDVYSLGVILYELLAGQLPFEPTELRRCAIAEVQRILQQQDPPRPSQKVETAGHAGGPAAAARRTDLRTLRRRLRGDLDWVVMRALEKDPDRRYPTAHELAAEVQRVLRHEPVQAGPPSARYRLGKFVRRHRAKVAATVVAVAAVIVGGALATVGLVRATRERERTQQEAARAQAVTGFLTGMLSSVQPEKAQGEQITVRQVLDEAAARLAQDAELSAQPEVEATLRNAIGDTYKALGLYEAALTQLGRALQLRRAQFGPADERVLETLDHIGEVHWRQGDLPGSLKTAQEVVDVRARAGQQMDSRYSRALGNLAATYADMGDYEQAERLMREALSIDRRVLRVDQGDALAVSLNNLASVLGDAKRYAEAIPLHRESLELRRKFLGERSPAVATSLGNLGFALLGAGQRDSAVTVLREAAQVAEQVFGAEHPRTAIALMNLGGALRGSEHPQEAEPLLRRAVAINAAAVGERAWQTGAARGSLGTLLVALGRPLEAEQELLAAYDVLREALGVAHERPKSAAAALADLYRKRDDTQRAIAWQLKADAAP